MTQIYRETRVRMADGVLLYTVAALPRATGSFPIVFIRSPYDPPEITPELILADARPLLDQGYAVVRQHCRGSGRSKGVFIPYVSERQDGLETLQWIRRQDFYQGEIYPVGGSYLAAVHLLYLDARPEDVKGAILEMHDSDYYRIFYRNGFFRISLFGWFTYMYQLRSKLRKDFVVPDSYRILPLCDYSLAVFNERVPSFDDLLRHPQPEDPFWQADGICTNLAGAVRDATIPILLTTSFYDIFADGILDLWTRISSGNRGNCAMLVTPYDHTNQHHEGSPLKFKRGELADVCPNYVANWLNHIRCGEPLEFIQKGKIAYYVLFRNEWRFAEYLTEGPYRLTLYLNDRELAEKAGATSEITYTYNPYAPAGFRGGICNDFDGMQVQDPPNSRYDIISFVSSPLSGPLLVRGKMNAELHVRSDCTDTCFYIRVSIVKNEVAYALRDDITSLSQQIDEYRPGDEAVLCFSCTPIAFELHPGDRIRIDVSSSCFPVFSIHTNNKGPQNEQKTARIAHNTLICGKSRLILYHD
ncbi:MAG TPA: hypothetical protein DD640_00500 [Clostridiales bacterium]|nr:hypothetical protein [Clostridiales bacterium]